MDPINRDFSEPAERVRLMACRLIGNYPAKEYHHYYRDAQPSNDSDAVFKSRQSKDWSAHLKSSTPVWTGICGKTPVLCSYFCDFARLSVI